MINEDNSDDEDFNEVESPPNSDDDDVNMDDD